MNRSPHQGVLCPSCKKRMFSHSRHHYWTCGCENDTMIDGGKDYLRYGWMKVKPEVIDYDESLDALKPPKPKAKRKKKATRV